MVPFPIVVVNVAPVIEVPKATGDVPIWLFSLDVDEVGNGDAFRSLKLKKSPDVPPLKPILVVGA